MEQTTSEPRFMSYKQLSAFLNVPPGTIYGWVAQGRIPCIRLGKRLVRFDREAITKWVAGHEVQPQ